MQKEKTQQKQQYKFGHKFDTNFYWCDFCEKWIPKNAAVMTTKKIRTYPTCPKPDCNKNRLKTKSTNYKYKSKDDAERRRSKEY
jgi:hypothetical protein